MISIFTDSFGTTFQAVLQVLLIALAAGILMRKKILTDEQIKAISAIGVRILLPCMIFSNIILNFEPASFNIWPMLPASAFLMVGAGIVFALILFWPNINAKKYLFAPAALQNAGYLILPVGKFLYPDQFDKFAMYCFLYILGLSPILWSLGKYLVSSLPDEKPSIKNLFTPPFVANILAIALVLLKLKFIIPGFVINSIDLLGTAAVPVATFVLGAVLGSIPFGIRGFAADAIKVLAIRLLLVPLVTIGILLLTGLNKNYPLLCNLFVLQSSSSPATALILQVKHYGGKEHELGSILLLSYIACIFTMPFWLAIWSMIIS
ncbi:MAG: AEC family transporter [Phycisphaerales bacterium]